LIFCKQYIQEGGAQPVETAKQASFQQFPFWLLESSNHSLEMVTQPLPSQRPT
jgi:hypothetical protein